MEINEIKKAIGEGKRVYMGEGYEVIKDNLNQYFIKCYLSGSLIRLTNLKGDMLNGKIEDFYIKKMEEKIRITMDKQERMDLINAISCIDLSKFENTVLEDFKNKLKDSIK